MNRRRNLIIAACGILAIVAIGVLSTSHASGGGIPVREATVHYTTFTTKLPETGVVQRPRLLTIPAFVGGNMGIIQVQAGDRVTKGQLLATISNPQIVSNMHDAEDAAIAAEGRAKSAQESNIALPAQNRSSVVQAQAAVVQARAALVQARQDLVAGAQSGLGYGGSTAEEQRLNADAAVSKAQTDLREAKRLYEANQNLYDNKAISYDALLQSKARYEQMQVTADQAVRERTILAGSLGREDQVLHDRVRAAENQLSQAQAALSAAQANALSSKAGDLEAARGDAARAEQDLNYARDQVEHLEIRAPFDGTVQSVASETGDALRPLQPGDAVTVGQPLFTLAAGGGFIVRTKVDEQDIAGVQIGQRAIVTGEDFGGASLRGHVVAISPAAQRSDDPANTSRQVLTTIALDQTLPFLRDGMTADVDIVTATLVHVIAVPVDALRSDPKGGNYVFIVRAGKAVKSPVKLGPKNDTQAVIRSGVANGDVVVADKDLDVVPDAAVTAAPTPLPSGAAPAP